MRLAVCSLLLLTTTATTALAAERPPPSTLGTAYAAFELSFFTRSENNAALTLVAPRLTGELKLGQHFAFGLDWAFIYAADSLGSTTVSTFRMGNPLVAVHYVSRGDRFRLELGASFGLPLAQVPEDDRLAAQSAYLAAFAMNGFRNLWLWYPDRLPLVLDTDLELDVAIAFFGLEFAVAPMFDTSDRGGEQDTEVAIQLIPRGGIRTGDHHFGLRVPAVWLPTLSAGDNAQLALEPYYQLALGKFFIRGSFTILLDDPFGFSFSSEEFWRLTIGAGSSF